MENKVRSFLKLWLACATLVSPAFAVPGDTGTYYSPAITALAENLQKYYVLPQVGRAYAHTLRQNLTRGSYRGITDPAEIGKRLTDDLRKLHQDLHLRVRPVSTTPVSASAPTPQSPPIEDPKWIADGIAYIRFNLFPGTPETVAATKTFMTDHATAKAIIIDARHNHGGGGDETNVMLPYLFASHTPLLDMELSSVAAKEYGYTEDTFFRRVPAAPGEVRFEQIVQPDPNEHRLFSAKVFYLTSMDTGSAAEALAFIFKITHRATLVGEHTRGMDHFGQFVPIGQSLECFLPMGRTFDPKTGTDWEGTGVIPDVVTSPGEALNAALKLIQR